MPVCNGYRFNKTPCTYPTFMNLAPNHVKAPCSESHLEQCQHLQY